MAKKAKHIRVTKKLLKSRLALAEEKGWGKAKWIEFCEKMMSEGYYVKIYEARKTVSKYLTVIDPLKSSHKFKVRFSNHKPIKSKEIAGDCDFFVGVTNLGVTTTEDAIKATLQFFEMKEKEHEKIDDDTLKHRPFDSLRNYGSN